MKNSLPIISLLLVCTVIALFILRLRLRAAIAARDQLQAKLGPIEDANAEATRIRDEAEKARAGAVTTATLAEAQRIAEEQKLAELREAIESLQEDFKLMDEKAGLVSFGFYTPRYDFAHSQLYQERLAAVREEQKRMLKEDTAAVCTTEWIVGGSKAEGKKHIKNTLKLALRAFNGECDAAVSRVKYNNIALMEARIRKAFDAINGMIKVQHCSITDKYLDLKIQELTLAFEYQEKVQMEKDEQRRIREQMKEEEQAQREAEKARQESEREEKRFADALAKAREEAAQAVGDQQDMLMSQIAELQRKLTEAQQNKERAVAQAQLTRAGHVYIISNIGSFGENVYKIGMTRRLDPDDRVRELGDASVPFDFDVHAMIYSDDAPALENTLHREFHFHRVNRVNEKKEFFRISVDELLTAVKKHHGEVEFVREAEAPHYRQTLAMIEEGKREAVAID